MKRFYVVATLIGILVVSFIIIRAYEKHIIPSNKVSTKIYQSDNVEVLRDKYYLRNFMWSGIFPFYGGFISDPHFLFQETVDATEDLSSVFQAKDIRYQLTQVNPYFENNTSELILSIEVDGLPLEYRLEHPRDFYPFSSKSEPRSAFLYNKNFLYFVLQYKFGDEFLIYEIVPPFKENKNLKYHLININESNVSELLNFTLTQDQVDMLLEHPYPSFYRFYTQYLNRDYAVNQIQLEKGKAINMSVYYGANLNINRSKMKNIKDETYALKVHNSFEFITSTQNVSFSDIPSKEKILLEVDHENYYDINFLGNSFETSNFAIRNEKKFVLIDYVDIDRLLQFVAKYKELRKEKLQNIEYIKELKEGTRENNPIQMEIITQYNNEVTSDRYGTTVLILPSKFSYQAKQYSNRIDYALPGNVSFDDYFFVIGFRDFSLKFSYNEVQKLELYLKSVRN